MGGLSFHNPAFLWGMLLAGLPIILHLLNRRRALRWSFSAYSFVMKSHKRLARRLKIKQLLLLLLRCLLLGLIPLALARPYWKPPQAPTVADDQGPAARMIVLDASMSMRAEMDGQSLFGRAIARARTLLGNVGRSDAVGLCLADALHLDCIPPGFDRADVLDKLEHAQAGLGTTDLLSALEQARVLVSQHPLERKRVHLIGDFTRTGYDWGAPPFSGEQAPALLFHDLRDGRMIPNLAVTDLSASRSVFSGPLEWTFSVTVSNFSDQPRTRLPLGLFYQGESLASGFVDVDAQGSAVKSFSHRFEEPGLLSMEARIGNDALPDDNRRSLILDVQGQTRVLLCNGQPSTVRHRDELFYLRPALSPAGEARSSFVVQEITSDQLLSADFSKTDVLALTQVAALSAETAQAITAFVQQGGGLFVSLGPSVDAENYNSLLGPLLPGRLRGEKAAGDALALEHGEASAYLSQFDYGHPVFRIFDDSTAQSLYQAKIHHYYLYDPDPRQGKRIWLRYRGGQPAVVEVPFGKGRVVLFTSTVDREWNDLCIQTGFLPLMQETFRYLSGVSGVQTRHSLKIGEDWLLADLGSQPSLRVTMPDGQTKTVEVVDGEARLDALSQRGCYTTQRQGRPIGACVNPDPVESDLTPLGDEARQGNLPEGTPEAFQDRINQDEQQVEYAGLILLLMLLAFLSEVLVIRWID